ncbi:hypothetical protein QBC38DRAFT_548017 [Podospora fimiseda]|uniref:Uncharacterized protein n=1 Tax=Podospora fimiseda TaxID=252190 RepID=A0AAN7BIL8_9PEZI|nr:hypothetical protein QBC38DRAFT_548017 [Podospora fimiseda]
MEPLNNLPLVFERLYDETASPLDDKAAPQSPGIWEEALRAEANMERQHSTALNPSTPPLSPSIWEEALLAETNLEHQYHDSTPLSPKSRAHLKRKAKHDDPDDVFKPVDNATTSTSPTPSDRKHALARSLRYSAKRKYRIAPAKVFLRTKEDYDKYQKEGRRTIDFNIKFEQKRLNWPERSPEFEGFIRKKLLKRRKVTEVDAMKWRRDGEL